MTTTPGSLLERLRRPGDLDAWEHFVRLYTPLLRSWARHKLGLNAPDAADLVQDVFTVLVQRLPEFRYDPHKRFRGWLWTVTLNAARARHRRRPTLVAPGAPEPRSEPAEPDVADAVAEKEYRAYLTRRALELMRAKFRSATWTAFWETVVNERPAADVARELGLTENAIYLAKGRVLRRLRIELDGLLE
jgi:RNA polymerase sigma-70 factor (ECF subfamily)